MDGLIAFAGLVAAQFAAMVCVYRWHAVGRLSGAEGAHPRSPGEIEPQQSPRRQ